MRRDRAEKLLRDLAVGIDPLEAKAERRTAATVAELVELYLADGPPERPTKKASTWAFETSSLRRHVIPLIGSRTLASLTPAIVERMQADIAAGKTAADIKTGKQGRAIVKGGKAVAGHATAVLSIVLSFAVRRRLIAVNPAIGVEKLKPQARERFLTMAEVVALADAMEALEAEHAINPMMATALRLLTLTACRKSEITGLKWAWVDLGRSCLRLPDSKTGAKVVPIPAAAVELLASLPRTSTFVLPSNKGEGPIVGLQKAWEAVRTRATAMARSQAIEAGLPPEQATDFSTLRMHDLRHSYASFAVEDGSSLYILGKVLGHAQASTTQRYAHLRDDPLKAVVDRTGAKIAEAMRVGTARNRTGT